MKADTERALVEHLSFHERITNEANRTLNYDVVAIETKANKLREKMNELSIFKNTQAFQQQYFSSI